MGDFIFDNDGYIFGEFGVIEQMCCLILKGWWVFKVVVDGDCIEDIFDQFKRVLIYIIDVVVSIGGNDFMKFCYLFGQVVEGVSLEEFIILLFVDFEMVYGWMLDIVFECGYRVSVCIIYIVIFFVE